MKNLATNAFLTGLLLLAMLSISFAQDVNPGGGLQVETVVEKEEVVIGDNGEQTTRLVPVARIVPGEEVVYTITFTNNSTEAAENVAITNPIPNHMLYVDDSAFGPGTEVGYSVDGGNSYASADELEIVDADGSVRRARADDYTHIRWVMRNDLQSGARGFARFRAVLQ